ncbi:MAG: phosphocholine cytidylyltransferase family protein [Firmicutes bacterium]|nr:phosphocholine cytidylyltransferase family protein [Bacillota bacterium]
MKAIIFNSGLGSRMAGLTENNPKCMVKLYNGETIFERQIRILGDCGIKDFIITTGPFKEQLYEVSEKFKNLNFQFVANEEYKCTNYIVSMNNASQYLDDDVLLLHGDLVFNKRLIEKILDNKNKSVCLYNEVKELPEKDFKGRFKNNKLLEVSVNIFDDDCYAFQPLYKLDKGDLQIWKDKVAEFVKNGNVKVYAENALNEITEMLNIQGMSYKDDYIDEIDNEIDYNRVSNEIKEFDNIE